MWVSNCLWCTDKGSKTGEFLHLFIWKRKTCGHRHTVQEGVCVRVCVCVCVCHSVMSDSLQPRGLLPTRLLYPWDSPGENTEDIVIPFSRGCSWPRYLTWVSYISRQILYHLSQQGSLCRRIHTAKESEKPASRYKVIDKEWEWDKPDDFTEGLAFQ